MESVPTMAYRTTILCIVVGMLLTTTVIEAQQFTIEPESVVQAEGLLAEFECLSPGALGHLWFVNGVESTSPDFSSEIRVAGGTSGRPSVLTIPASSQFNNSVIQCAAVSLSGGVLSRNATLIVERIILEVLNGETKITVSVMNNFTMNNLACRVDISLVPLVTNEIVALPPLNGIQNQVQFNYQQLKNHTVCDIFTFTVTPITSESGMEGRSSEPVTGFFTQVADNNNVAPLISQGGNVSRKIVHLGGMVPNCTNFTSYQVNYDNLSAPINKTMEYPQTINFSLPTDLLISVSVTLRSIMGVRLIFKDMQIRTTDVQNLIVDMDICPKENCASIKYVEGTLSPGALLCVIRIIDGELDFQSIRLLPIRRNMSDNFTIPVAVSGKYSVVAFDLENNNMSVPRIPISIVADNETMFLSNESSTEPHFPPNSEGITVTKLSNGSTEVTCTTSGQSCLALFQSKTSSTFLDPMVIIGLIEPPNDGTVVTLNATSNVYVVVYTWNSDSGETIFDGKVSFISQLELPTTPPPTQPPPDTTGSPAPSPIVLSIVIVVTVVIVFIAIILIVVVVVLYLVKRYKGGSKVSHSSYNHYQFEIDSQGRSTNRASQELGVGTSTTSQEEIIPLYDVARIEYMSPDINTPNTDDAPPPGYDVICKENIQAEYETVPLVLSGKPTFTSENPPPLPPPMIQGDSETPDLPPPYNPAVDSESVVVMSVESSISQGVENQSVDGEVDELVERVSNAERDGTTEEAIGSSEAQPNKREMDHSLSDPDKNQSTQVSIQGNESKAVPTKQEINNLSDPQVVDFLPIDESNQSSVDDYENVHSHSNRLYNQIQKQKSANHGGQEAMIAAQHQYTLVVPKPASSDAKVVDSSKVIYSEMDKNKLVPVAKTQELRSQYTPVETKPASSATKVMDPTKVVYVQVDKDKHKPVDPNDPPALPPQRPVTNTGELHTERH